MNFQPELADKVVRGEKTVTRRAMSENPRSPWWETRCSLRPGRDYAVCPGRGKHAIGRVRVVTVLPQLLGWVGDAEAVREGFETPEAFANAWLAINGSYSTPVWRVEFEVAA